MTEAKTPQCDKIPEETEFQVFTVKFFVEFHPTRMLPEWHVLEDREDKNRGMGDRKSIAVCETEYDAMRIMLALSQQAART